MPNKKMTKAQEALKNIREEAGTPYFSSLYDIDMWREDFATVEKELKAVEIIKKKKVDINELFILWRYRKGEELKIYNGCRQVKYKLNQEEYELLKRCLNE